MDREFLEHYERELEYLYENSQDFATKYPGVADRLGGLSRDSTDAGFLALIEGSAYLAARVQLKIKSQFSEFTKELLEQLLPGYLAPTPSAMLVQASPDFSDQELIKGQTFPRGSYIDANYVEVNKDVSCRYRLSSPITLWPIEISEAGYFSNATPLQALGLDVQDKTSAGLRLCVKRRTTKESQDKARSKDPGGPVNQLALDTVDVYLTGSDSEASALYEQIFANCVRVSLRSVNSMGVAKFHPLPRDCIDQVGFDEDEPLFLNDERQFSGFSILREFFVFPRKFMGFRLRGLNKHLSKIPEHEFDILFEFNRSVARLASITRKGSFGLFSAPAVNLFEMQCSRIAVRSREHEHNVVPDRSRWLDYETHQILDVYAHFQTAQEKVPVFPIYKLPISNTGQGDSYYYSQRRLPRRATEEEKRFGLTPDYMGDEVFLTLNEPDGREQVHRIRELSVRAFCSNRHLPSYLPTGDTNVDFKMVDDTEVPLSCLIGPTPPTASIVDVERLKSKMHDSGSVLWRLINFLSFNHIGLMDRQAQSKGAGIRELLSLFADISDAIDERRIRGIVSVDTRPVVRRLRQENGFNAARGIEITLTFDEEAFEGIGILVFGAALDRYFAHYSSINSFTQTVIKSAHRGVVKTFPPRSGTGIVL